VLKMTLRDDIKWSDGEPVTPEDFKFTWDLIGDTTVASPLHRYTERLQPDQPTIIDDTHIEWRFTEAYDRDTQVAHVAQLYMPKHIFADADRATLKGHPRNRDPLVTGPFKLLEVKPNERIVLAPNENFTGPDAWRPKLKRVMLKIVPEYQTRLLQLKAGDVDMMNNIQISDADDLRENNPNLKLIRRGHRFLDYVGWNLKNPKFQDKRVRQALAHAINIDFMIEKILTSKDGTAYAKKAISTITPELCNVHNNDVTPFPFSQDKAKALFAEAGWSDTDGDGFLDKDGQKFTFSLITNRDNERRKEAGQIMQAQLKEVGVDMQLTNMDFNAMLDKMHQRDFEAILSGWSAALLIDPSNVWMSDSEDRRSEYNFSSYANPKVDALIQRGLQTTEPDKAAPIWREMQAEIYDDQPSLFLWWRDSITAVDSRFENVQVNILSSMNNLHEWEVPPDKVKHNL